jgi:hypothetical protein
MATFTLNTPVTVGDMSHQIVVDKVDLVSVSINFTLNPPIVSCILLHVASGWSYPVTFTGAEAVSALTAIRNAIPGFDNTILTLLAGSGKLPAGTVS